MASFTGVLLAILMPFFIVTPVMRSSPRITLVEVKNYQYEPGDEMVTIQIDKKGGVWVNYSRTGDDYLSKLGILIEDSRESRKQREPKVLLKADQTVPYEKIVQIFQILTKVGIKTVGLVTEGHSNPLLDFMIEEKITRW